MKNLPQTQSALKRRAQLEAALLALMRTRGYAQITVTDICREADIPRRTFYHYFDSKEAVLHAVVKSMLQSSRAQIMLFFIFIKFSGFYFVPGHYSTYSEDI